jgi:predicted anti-sigma-YlaC factor YlaD
MKCKIAHKKLIFYSAGKLNDAENEEIKTHLQTCDNCHNLYIELKSTLILVEKKKTLEPNPFLYTRINEKLANLESEKDQAVITPVYKKVLQPIFFTFLLAIGLFSGVKLGNTVIIDYQNKLSVPHITAFYFNDFQQEKLEVFLLNE